MKIAGVWSGQDTSFCILEDGIPILHTELEQYNIEKEPQGDSILLMNNVYQRRVEDIREILKK